MIPALQRLKMRVAACPLDILGGGRRSSHHIYAEDAEDTRNDEASGSSQQSAPTALWPPTDYSVIKIPIGVVSSQNIPPRCWGFQLDPVSLRELQLQEQVCSRHTRYRLLNTEDRLSQYR
jgi:hypothetical protein